MTSTQPGLPRRSVLAARPSPTAVGLPSLSPLPGTAPAAPLPMFGDGVAPRDRLPTADPLRTRGSAPAAPRAFRGVVRRGTFAARARRGHSVKLDAPDLRPGGWYFYRCQCKGVTSPVGRTRTAPAHTADVGRLRVGLVSCSRYEDGYFA